MEWLRLGPPGLSRTTTAAPFTVLPEVTWLWVLPPGVCFPGCWRAVPRPRARSPAFSPLDVFAHVLPVLAFRSDFWNSSYWRFSMEARCTPQGTFGRAALMAPAPLAPRVVAVPANTHTSSYRPQCGRQACPVGVQV